MHVTGITSAADSIAVRIVTSNRTYKASITNTNTLGSVESQRLSVVADMDAADTATVTMTVSGEASDVCDIKGSTDMVTNFSGCLLA